MDSVYSVDYLFSTRIVTEGCPQANEEDIVYHRNLNGIYTEVRWRCSVSTALIIYPQMSDICYTDFYLFQICLTSVDYLFSTEDTEGHGGGLTKTITKTLSV